MVKQELLLQILCNVFKKVSQKQGLELLKLQIWEVYIYIYIYISYVYIFFKFIYIHENICYPNKWASKIPLYLTHRLYWVFILSQNSWNILIIQKFSTLLDTLGITTGAIILEFLIKPHFSGRNICFDLFYLLDFPHGVYLMN